ncbi:MAG: hypothetical protein ABIZ80_03575, partial [Bryobacteraceae bacterium]
MRRRTFVGAGLGALQLRGAAGGTMKALPRVEGLGARLLFLDAENIAESNGVQLAPPPVRRIGPLITADSPGDDAGVSAAMGCGQFQLESGGYRLYYSGRGKEGPAGGICVAESDNGKEWRKPLLGQMRLGGKDSNRILIKGVPDGVMVTQPSILPLADGRFRMYFWMHERAGEKRRLRYLAAESRDGLQWVCSNYDKPCLIHPHELGKGGWLDGPESRARWQDAGTPSMEESYAKKRIRSNDAVHTYALPGGGFAMYSVFPVFNSPAMGRYVPEDNAPFIVRVMTRRTSSDGLSWSDPEFIVTPDAKDPWDQQFYYLTEHRFDDFRIGFLGHYRVQDQTMDIEMAYSRDGRAWRRPMRGAWIARGAPGSGEAGMLYMPNYLLDRGDHWLVLYTAMDTLHNQPDHGKRSVFGAEIGRHRFAGFTPLEGRVGRIRTAPYFLSGSRVLLDAKVEGSLRAELCNAFGQPLPGLSFADSVPVTGDNSSHELRWKKASAEAYRSYPVSLRLEWTQGAVFSV